MNFLTKPHVFFLIAFVLLQRLKTSMVDAVISV